MNIELSNKLRKYKLFFAIIVIIQVFLLIHIMNNKEIFFCDEIYSYSLANFGYGDLVSLCKNRWVDGKAFNEYITAPKDKCFDYEKVYKTQTLDVHPPVFYYLLHTICSFFPEKFSKWYGFSINILSFILVQLILFKVSQKIFNSEIYSLITCLIYGFSSCAIDSFIFIRMYSVLTVFYMLLLYIYIHCLDNKTSIFRFISIVLVVMLGGLTQYHFYVFAFFLTLSFVVYFLLKKQNKMFWLVSIGAISGVILANIYYPYFFTHLFNSPRGDMALSLHSRITPALQGFSYALQEFFGWNPDFSLYFSLILMIVAFMFFIYKLVQRCNSNIDKSALLLTLFSTFIYTLVLFLTIDMKSMGIFLSGRFFFTICPIVAIVIVSILYSLQNKYLSFLVIALCLFNSVNGADFNFSYSSSLFSGIDELEKIIENKNLIIICNDKGKVLTICPQLAKCNAIYVNLLEKNDAISLPSIDNSKPVYLFVFPRNKGLNIKFPKVIDGIFWGNEYELYSLKE